MLYSLFTWLKQEFNISGAGVFQYITFRAAMAILLSLFIATVYGKRIINLLSRKQIGETVRDLGLAGEAQKKGTPTMGGIIILLAIIIPTLLLADLDKVYVRLMLLCTVWLGAIGFLDDYLKIKSRRKAQQKGEQYKKKDSDGLAGTAKIIGQIGLGIIIGATLYFNHNVSMEREVIPSGNGAPVSMTVNTPNESIPLIERRNLPRITQKHVQALRPCQDGGADATFPATQNDD